MHCNVFLLGGGTRLAAHLGALKALEERGGRIAAWAGASAGSLVSAVRASGYTSAQAFDLMLNTDYRKFFDVRPLGLIRGYGLCSGKPFEKWLDGVTGGKCFQDLDVPLSVVCADVDTGEAYICSNDLTPDMKISTAVRCSISIPGIFAVRRVNGSILVDGSLARVEPSMIFPNSSVPAIAVRQVRNQAARMTQAGPPGFTDYVKRVADLILNATDDRSSPELWEHNLFIRTGHHSPVNFDLTSDDKHELYEMGYQQIASELISAAQGCNNGTTDVLSIGKLLFAPA